VSSGPYLIAGASKERLSPGSPTPAVELPSGSSITLLRNPSWDPANDPTRPAYVDRIHITIGGTAADNAALVDRDDVDLQFEGVTATPKSMLSAYAADTALAKRMVTWGRASVWTVSINLAVPPFDDVHVRRAVAYAMNTDDLLRDASSAEGSTGMIATGEVAKHLVPDAAEAGLLTTFDPFPGHAGPERRSRARSQLQASPYETDRDGNCIDTSCVGVSIWVDGSEASRAIAETLRLDLHAIGIDLAPPIVADAVMPPGAAHAALYVTLTAPAAYPNASTFFLPLLGSGSATDPSAEGEPSMLGAPSETLERLGYEVTEVPSIDARIRACTPLSGSEQIDCWALLDKYVMLEIIPWVPFLTETYSAIVSSRLRNVHADPLSRVPALDQIWIDPVPRSSSP
jgi:ABC-type transport system substrate-binding protein